jgi:hypothetical protein
MTAFSAYMGTSVGTQQFDRRDARYIYILI